MVNTPAEISRHDVRRRWKAMVRSFQVANIPCDIVSYLALIEGIETMKPMACAAFTEPLPLSRRKPTPPN